MRAPYYEDGSAQVYVGDCLDVLAELPDETFDLVVTSPPYNLGGVDSGFATPGSGNKTGKWSGGGLAGGYAEHDDCMPHDQYVTWQQSVLSELWRVIKPSGAIFYNHKPRPREKALWLPLELIPKGVTLRQVIVWARAGGVNFSPAHYCPSHEWIMLLAKPDWALKSRAASGVGDVWYVPQEPSDHPAPFPIGIPARAIETTGATIVLDPFCGSGTTLRAAKNAGVQGVGIELSERYADMSVRRLAQGSLF